MISTMSPPSHSSSDDQGSSALPLEAASEPDPARAPSRTLAFFLAFSIFFLASLASVLQKLSLSTVSPITFSWLQILIGGAILSAYTFGWRRERLPSRMPRALWWHIMAIGVLNFTFVRTLIAFSLERLPATTFSYLVNYTGIITMLLSVVILRERPGRFQILGVVLGLIGLQVYFSELPSADHRIGIIFTALTVFSLALINILTRRLAVLNAGKVSNIVLSTIAVWVGGAPILIWGVCRDGIPDLGGVQPWLIIAFNGLVAIALGLTIWLYVMRAMRSYEASVLATTTMIFAALLAMPILGERLDLHEWTGMAIVIAGIILVQWRTNQSELEAPAEKP